MMQKKIQSKYVAVLMLLAAIAGAHLPLGGNIVANHGMDLVHHIVETNGMDLVP